MDDYQPELSFASHASASFHDHRGDEKEAVEFLAAYANSGPVLELAVGTGRIALPLAQQGLTVDGIDISPNMLEFLASKTDGAKVKTTLGDFADVDVPGTYPLIFIVWNSFFNLLTQTHQVRCFNNVAEHLTAQGRFIIEAYVPNFPGATQKFQRIESENLALESVRIGVLHHDLSRQTIEQNHVTLSSTGPSFDPVVQRYAWPAEMDLMARLAGLRLIERFSDWHRAPFDANSTTHISVYGREI